MFTNATKYMHGYTPLLFAVEKGNLAAMRCLVKELGADVNQRAHRGATPLHVAVELEEGLLDALQCLAKELGADVNQGT
jgi:ankyrin repeat protein